MISLPLLVAVRVSIRKSCNKCKRNTSLWERVSKWVAFALDPGPGVWVTVNCWERLYMCGVEGQRWSSISSKGYEGNNFYFLSLHGIVRYEGELGKTVSPLATAHTFCAPRMIRETLFNFGRYLLLI